MIKPIENLWISPIKKWHTGFTSHSQKEEKMNAGLARFNESWLGKLYHSFSPASRAVIWLALPFTLLDALHYYTAGAALIFSLPLLMLIYFLCGSLAARLECVEGAQSKDLPRIGQNAAVRLWLISTVINTLLAFVLGLTSLGITIVSSAFYLCLAPIHLAGSALIGRLGGWIYQKLYQRTGSC